MRVLRSPLAHARLGERPYGGALALPGVETVLTGEDLEQTSPIPIRTRSEHDLDAFLQPVLARDRVRYVGEPVAVVLAEDAYLAEDAAELVEVEYEELPVALDASEAIGTEASRLRDGCNNEAATLKMGYGDVEAAFERRRARRRGRRQDRSPLRGAPGDPGPRSRLRCGERSPRHLGGDQGTPLQPAGALADAGYAPEPDQHEEVRRGGWLWRAGRVLPGGLPGALPGPPDAAPREVDRGPPGAPRGHQPLPRAAPPARGGLRRGAPAAGFARRGVARQRRLHPHPRRHRSRPDAGDDARALQGPRLRGHRPRRADQQDALRHLPWAGTLRGDLLPRAPARRGQPRSSVWIGWS